jgi:hypothetical protein
MTSALKQVIEPYCYLFMWPKWKRVYYYWGHLLAYSTALYDRCWSWVNRWNEWLAGETRSTGSKPASVPLCPPQIPHDLTQTRTLAVAVGSLRLTAWGTTRPRPMCYCITKSFTEIGKEETNKQTNKQTPLRSVFANPLRGNLIGSNELLSEFQLKDFKSLRPDWVGVSVVLGRLWCSWWDLPRVDFQGRSSALWPLVTVNLLQYL